MTSYSIPVTPLPAVLKGLYALKERLRRKLRRLQLQLANDLDRLIAATRKYLATVERLIAEASPVVRPVLHLSVVGTAWWLA